MKLRRLVYGFSTAILSVSSLFVLVAPAAHAANVTWDGGGADLNFSTAANWSADTLPVDGDVLVFDINGLTSTITLNNDLVGFTAGGFNTTGTNGSFSNYVITGNAMNLSGNITGTFSPTININLTLTADVAVLTTRYATIGDDITSYTFDLGGHTLTLSSGQFVYMKSSIIGNGNLVSNNAQSTYLFSDNTFTGQLTVNDSLIASKPGSIGNASNTVTVSGVDAKVYFCKFNGASIAQNFVLNASNTSGILITSSGCGAGGTDTSLNPIANVNLTGSVTLQQNTVVSGSGELTISGPLGGAFTISMASGSVGKLTLASSSNQSLTPNGSQASALNVIEISDKQPSMPIFVGANQVVVINAGAERDTANITGGTLKGIGTVGRINMGSGSVAPGMSPGILSSGDIDFTGGTLEVEIGGTTAGNYDQLNVTGTVSLGTSATSLNVSHWNSFRPAVGNTFVIINNDAADAVTGTFSGLAQGATVTVGDVVYTISYTGGDGNDVVLTATTVPAAPNTGFEQIKINPILSIVVTLLAVAGIAYVARTQLTQTKK